MNKCPFCKQEIKEENQQVLVKINDKPMRFVGKKYIARRYKSGHLSVSKGVSIKPIPVLEVESK